MKLQVTLVKSPVSSKPNHIKTVKALGLHKIRSTKVFEDDPVYPRHDLQGEPSGVCGRNQRLRRIHHEAE